MPNLVSLDQKNRRGLGTSLRHAVYALSNALDLVGIGDTAHGKRVAIMAAECAAAMHVSAADKAFAFDLGLLHDIGVSTTETHRHLLSEFDWESAQDHCEAGYALLHDFLPLARFASADQIPSYPLGCFNRFWSRCENSTLGQSDLSCRPGGYAGRTAPYE